jgi:hypothetical protein
LHGVKPELLRFPSLELLAPEVYDEEHLVNSDLNGYVSSDRYTELLLKYMELLMAVRRGHPDWSSIRQWEKENLPYLRDLTITHPSL